MRRSIYRYLLMRGFPTFVSFLFSPPLLMTYPIVTDLVYIFCKIKVRGEICYAQIQPMYNPLEYRI